MNGNGFAQRVGYREPPLDFEDPDYLPHDVREQAAVMMVDSFEKHMPPPPTDALAASEGLAWPHIPAYRRFAKTVRDSLPPSQETPGWYQFVTQMLSDPSNLDKQKFRRISPQPLVLCDWRLFYTVVECVCTEWRTAGTQVEEDFASDFNYLLRFRRIPWELHGGLVIPSADSELSEDLKYAREVAHRPVADHVKDPHELIRDALAALYRKQGGPDLSAACVHAWGAWKAAASAASGFGARDGRTFEFVGDEYPALGSTMKAWQKLAEEGRHPETGAPLTESETRFIVMLCVNAVRFLCLTCRSDDAA